ncbi:MAG TPA: fused MFS/spermidine synthase, partial [Bryobacteraceae bacterium]|nr:fused MFS/spermidine synthase [Bryobacteraceae bacterium]
MRRSRAGMAGVGATIFLSSFLLFLVEPMFAKRILPWFGGSAAVWTTCLVFYQSALVAGYAYAAAMARRARPKWQATVHVVLLMAAVATLPIEARTGFHWAPAGAILASLTLSIGLPYFLLSATNPLLQSWWSETGAGTYRLFALSNAGALLALIAYPAAIEPRVTTHGQLRGWSIGFGIFAALCAVVAMGSARRKEMANGESEGVTWRQRMEWMALAAAGSMMLLATTNQLTQDVAPVPLLWIVPLAIYLATFVAAFESPRWYPRESTLRFLAIALTGVAYAISNIGLSDALVVSIPLFSIALGIACLFCHGELNRTKPGSGALTSFYLMIAIGGALGAVLVGLVAPAIFSGIYELPVSMLAVAVLALWTNWKAGWSRRALWAAVGVAMVVVGMAQARGYHHDAIELARNFYGSLRVVEANGVRILYHGTVEHGSQFQSPELRRTPTTYYGRESGVGMALGGLDRRGPVRIGVIGLGTGTLAAYGRAGDEFRFYEINPLVEEMARRDFSYLSDSAAKTEVVTGDARLSLEASSVQPFDGLVVDAFSGDAIPVHLLTREAIELYLRNLKSDGI